MRRKLMFVGTMLISLMFFVQCQSDRSAFVSNARELSPVEKEVKWSTLKKADDSIRIAPEWEAPVNIGPPANSIGWEDSPSISPDGSTLTFTYFRIDPIAHIFKKKRRVDGPMRPDWPQAEPFKTFGGAIYIASKVKGVWQEPTKLGPPVNINESVSGSQWLSPDGKRIYFSSAEGSRKKGIYYAERKGSTAPWGNLQYLNRAVNTGHDEDNPYLTPDERFLYFESSRPGGSGKKDLYVSEKVNGEWQQPRNLGPAINTREDDHQPYVSADGTILLFTRNEKIYRARRQHDKSWGTPEVIVSGTVGEGTLTASGDLFFLHVYKSSDDQFDADIMYARKKK